MKNFWKDLKKPFFILAPMDDVTDTVFRSVVAHVAAPEVFMTEFTNVEGFQSKGKEKLRTRFFYEESHRKIVAQIWGQNPENYKKTAAELVEMGFDGIDINMGCPVSKVVRRGSCSGLIHNPALAAEIIAATKEGAGGKIPVSVKTRLGINEINTDEWIGFLLKQNIDALTVHARTVKELSKVPAHWDEMIKVVKLRDEFAPETIIIGNGDVIDRADGLAKVKETGVDGVMIGRGIFKDVFAFSEGRKVSRSDAEMLDLLLFHARLFDKTWGQTKNFAILRRFFKIYTNGLADAASLREKLFQTNNLQEVEEIVSAHLNRS